MLLIVVFPIKNLDNSSSPPPLPLPKLPQDAQIDAVLSGIASVVPITLFPLFTPKEIEELFCGLS